MKRLPREFLQIVMENTVTNGKFFGLLFGKKDGTLRQINGHAKPNQDFSLDNNGYYTIWDRNANDWRKAHHDNIKELSIEGRRYKIV